MTTPAKLPHAGHRARLRERVDIAGIDSLLDHEFLELLLTYAIPRKDTKSLAWALLKRFGSLSSILDAEDAALQEVPGIGPHATQLLYLVREAFHRYAKNQLPKQIQLENLDDILDYSRYSLAGKHEEFMEIMFLSVRWTILGTRRVTGHSISAITLDPRKVVEMALKAKAKGLIIVHNHPSGDPRPSSNDMTWTENLEKALIVFDIALWEHLIITKSAHFSFYGHQLLHPKMDPTKP